MKRCALIISDDVKFREWLGCIIATRWPKILLEYSRVANAPMYLDRAALERYRVIVVRLGFNTFPELSTCIFLMRILNLESHPEIVLISDDEMALRRARSTRLGAAHCILKSEVTAAAFKGVLEKIAAREGHVASSPTDGGPSIPGYVIQYPLAATYSTTVYRAFSTSLHKDVALKVCEAKPSRRAEFHQLTLRQEYDVLRKLGGQYVAHAYDYGEAGGLTYLALEYFPRGSLSQFVRENGRKISRVDYMLEIARALREIHDAGFLHLDLKPNNVLIRQDGSPALIDFGISKRILVARYQDGQVFSMGSPYFMSPEQARGEPLDERSDIYSFGALWFRIFTGHSPFVGRSFQELCEARDNEAPSMGEALRHYQPIVDKTLAADRDARFASAQELIDNIEYYATSATGINRQPDLQEMERQARLHGI